MKLSRTNGLYSPTIITQEVSVEEFLSYFDHNRNFFTGVYNSEDCQRMLLVDYENVVDGEKHPRKGLTPKTIYGVIIEYDDGYPTLKSIINSDDYYTKIIYTSPSHQIEKHGKPPCDRFRIVIIFSTPCPYEEFKKRIGGFTKKFEGLDPTCLRLTQFQRVPMYMKNKPNPKIHIINTGKFFNWEDVPVDEVKPVKTFKVNIKGNSSEYLPIETEFGLLDKNDLVEHFNHSDSLISKVRCPTHHDKKPGCFIGILQGIPFVHCDKCGRTPLWETTSDDDSSILNKVKQYNKKKPKKPTKKPKIKSKTPPQPNVTSYDELMEIDESFSQPLTIEEIQDGLVNISTKLESRNLIFSREGTGKSYITKTLLDSGKRVLFTTSSNSQSDEKYQEFSTFDFQSLRLTSVTHLLKTTFDVEPVNLKPKHPWDMGSLNKEKTAWEVIKKHPELTLDEVKQQIEQFDSQSRLYWGDNQLIVTTHAMLIQLQQQNQKLMDEGKQPIIPTDVVIVVDDPNRQDFYPLKMWSMDFSRSFVNENYVKSHTFENDKGNQRRYFIKPEELTFGYGLPENQMIFTTTELVTSELISYQYTNLKEHDELDSDLPVYGGDLHILSTPWVWSKYDGLLPVVIERIGRTIKNLSYISDGQGSVFNHVNNKGINSLKDTHTVIEISKLVTQEIQEVIDNLSFYDHEYWKQKNNKSYIETIITVDKLNQSIGRNSGQRFKGKSCVVIIDPSLFEKVLRKKFYHFNTEIKLNDVIPSKQPESDSLVDLVKYHLVNYNRFYSQRNYLVDDVKKCLKNSHKDKLNQRKQRLYKSIDTFTQMNLGVKSKGGLQVSIKQEKLNSVKELLDKS